MFATAAVASERAEPSAPLFTRSFHVDGRSEAVAVVHARCSGCSWGVAGRESPALRLSVDGRYSQHLLLARGEAEGEYRVTLGALERGTHEVQIGLDPAFSARDAGGAAVSGVDVEVVDRARRARHGGDEFLAQSMAPILHARPNTVGRFTDLPILMWYEVVPTPRGRQFRYSVVFTNEDGGTAADRLMATWGRTTDIEYVYGAEVDAGGDVLREEFQGPEHKVLAFGGRHESKHPLLWVATDNNMVSDAGTTAVRYAPAPERFDLRDDSREVVMDAHPWSYTVAAQELARENKIDDTAEAASGKIPDLRRFVFVEACTVLEHAALSFSVRAASQDGRESWYDSDRGVPTFRIVRSGCFRGAVPLPAPAMAPNAVRFRAFSQRDKDGRVPAGSVRVTRINRVFRLGDDFLPGPSTFSWVGSLVLPLDGEWREVIF